MIQIGVIAPALELGQGTEGREKEVAKTKESEPLLYSLGEALGRADVAVALCGQLGLQVTIRDAYTKTAITPRCVEYSYYDSRDAMEKKGIRLAAECDVRFIGGGKESLANYEAMIFESDAVIFAGGFYRAAAAALMALHYKKGFLGVLLGAGETPQALLKFVDEMGLPKSARDRLVYDADPAVVIEELLRKIKSR